MENSEQNNNLGGLIELPQRVTDLRNKHPIFSYESYSVAATEEGLLLSYKFSIAPNLTFTPTISVPLEEAQLTATHQQELLGDPTVLRLAFLIGMVELISYWKLTCSPLIEVIAGHLEDSEIKFWEQLIRSGLGEFFFLNQISPRIPFKIASAERAENPHRSGRNESSLKVSHKDNSYLILVGGGKDSIVTLELIKNLPGIKAGQISSFAINPIAASLEAIDAAGYTSPLISRRVLDPLLRELNSQGYLNGHTPFSSLVAFLSTLTAYINGYHYILASNESSANEGNTKIHEFEVNHQYSKSFHFEGLFRTYQERLKIPQRYLSFLRPLNEPQICALFSRFTHQHQIFRSCNREQTSAAKERRRLLTEASKHYKPRTGWCAECPKCIFTAVCLSCFISQDDLEAIFGVNPFAAPAADKQIAALAGFGEIKPFECVGTYQEVRSCLKTLLGRAVPGSPLSKALLPLRTDIERADAPDIDTLLSRFNKEHFLSRALEELLIQWL
jgi:hypothetical protein